MNPVGFDEIKAAKKTLRKEMLVKRRAKSKEDILTASENLSNNLLSWEAYKKAKTVMLFLATSDEPLLHKVISHALDSGKTVCVPYIYEIGRQMDAAIMKSFDDLVVGYFNLLVPNPKTLKFLEPKLLDLIVLPGVAFDFNGNRLGMGAGYYDRFLLKASNAELIGAAWHEHILNAVPVEAHDKLVNYLVSEKGIFICGKGKM